MVAPVAVKLAVAPEQIAGELTCTIGKAFTRIDFVAAELALPDLYATKLMIYVPGVLNVGTTVVVDVDVPGTPPAIVQRTESGLPLLAVDVFVNVKLPPAHTVVSLAVKLAVAVGVVLGTEMLTLSI